MCLDGFLWPLFITGPSIITITIVTITIVTITIITITVITITIITIRVAAAAGRSRRTIRIKMVRGSTSPELGLQTMHEGSR